MVFEHDLDLEPVKVNSTTSRDMCKVMIGAQQTLTYTVSYAIFVM